MSSKLKVYFTSDIHGFVFPTNHADQSIKPMGLLGMIPQFQKDGNTLVLDCGDTIQGSPLTYYCQKESLPNPMIQVMNAAGYDYITLGNHDFNYGYDSLKEYLEGIHAKCVCANVKDVSARLPIVPYVLHTLDNGLRIGITGVVTNWVNRWEKPETLSHFEISDPFQAAQNALSAIEAQCDFTICLYHGGIEKDIDTGRLQSDTDENIACRICEELKFDLLLTGHQHIALENKTYCGTHLVQPPANATHFVKVDWLETGEIASSLIPSNLDSMPPIASSLTPLKNALDTWLDTPVGRLNRPLWPGEKLDMALHGTPIANFINQVQLEASGAEISCTSLPNEMRGFDQNVSVRDVVATYVYANTLVVFEVNGAVLKSALERCAAYFDITADGEITISRDFLLPKIAHYNYDFFAGICYTFDLSKPIGQRVASIMYREKSVEPNDKLTLCMNNYRATGVGGYEAYLQCKIIRQINVDVSELLLDYLLKYRDVSVRAESPLTILYPKDKIPSVK